MKSIVTVIAIAVFIFLSGSSSLGQTSVGPSPPSLILDRGVSPHKGLDEVYGRFSEGYKKLDAPSLIDLYSDTAAYLAPDDNIKIGRREVAKIFTGFFDSVKQRNGRLEISFRILQRQVDTNLAYDVGIYTLTSFNQKGEANQDSGKFVVVARRKKGDLWKFQVDGYSSLPKQ